MSLVSKVSRSHYIRRLSRNGSILTLTCEVFGWNAPAAHGLQSAVPEGIPVRLSQVFRTTEIFVEKYDIGVGA